VDFNIRINIVKVHECMHGVTYTKISVRAYTVDFVPQTDCERKKNTNKSVK